MTDAASSGQILVLADDSPAAKSAVRIATDIAEALTRPLVLLAVTGTEHPEEETREVIAEAQTYAKDRVSTLETVQAAGDLIALARRRVSETPTALVVLGANFRAGRREAVARRIWRIVKSLSPPVLAISARTEKISRCLFCTGGERFIEEGTAFAARLAAALGAQVEVFHVSPHAPAMYGGRVEREAESAEEFLQTNSRISRNVRRQIELFRSAGVETTFRVVGGDVVDQVLAEIRGSKADLVIVGSVPARGALETSMLGDLTREIIRRARKSFLVLRSNRPGFWSEIWKSFTEGMSGRPEKSPEDPP